MKRLLTVFLLLMSLCLPATASAASQDVLITELQTETTASASEEFITVTNNSGSVIDVTDWHLEYFSASAANFDTPSRNIPLTGTLAPKGTLVAASSGYKTDVAAVSFGAGLAAAGGHVRLVSGSGASLVQHDLIGWGTAVHPETTAVAVAAKGQLYTRKTSSGGSFIDTDNNANDFSNGATTPSSPVADPASSTGGTSQSEGIPADPVITELLPDPSPPTTDANGEFVELYNPNSTVFDLTGYKLQTGSSNSYSYTFKDGTLAPGEYKAFFAPETKLTLSNSGGKARLLDVDGSVVSETDAYGKVPTGSSWMLYGGVWGWTASPTPGAQNQAAVIGDTSSTGSTGASSKATKTTSTKTKTAAAKKKTATKAAKSAAATKGGDYKNPASDNQPLPVKPLLLAVVGVPLIGYMVYEYRHDLANLVAKFRRNRSRRRETRAVPSGR